MEGNLNELTAEHADVFPKKFLEWLEDNEHVYRTFRSLADRLWAVGRRHYGAKTLVEKIRFDTDVESVGDAFKINNNYAPSLARLYALEHPRRWNLFKYRRVAGTPDFIEYVRTTFGLEEWQ